MARSESAGVFLDIHKELVKLNTNQKHANEHLDRLSKTVYGDGNGNKGLVLKTDRVERTLSGYTKVVWASITGLGGLFTKALFEIFKSH